MRAEAAWSLLPPLPLRIQLTSRLLALPGTASVMSDVIWLALLVLHTFVCMTPHCLPCVKVKPVYGLQPCMCVHRLLSRPL